MNVEAAMRMKQVVKNIVITSPFFTQLAMKPELVENDGLPGPMATDGKRIWYSPSWVLKLPMNYLEYVFKHEVLHRVLGHCTETDKYDREVRAVAHDLAVNGIMMNAERFIPDAKILPGIFPGVGQFCHVPADATTDTYYALLMEDKERKKEEERKQRQQQQQQQQEKDNEPESDNGDSGSSSGGSGTGDDESGDEDSDSDGESEETGDTDKDGKGKSGKDRSEDADGEGDAGEGEEDGDDANTDERGEDDSDTEDENEGQGTETDEDDDDGALTEEERVAKELSNLPAQCSDVVNCDGEVASEEKEAIMGDMVTAQIAEQMNRGTMGGYSSLIANLLTPPEIPWKRQLRQYMTSRERRKLNYHKPSRRYRPDIVMPRKGNRTLGKCIIVADTSGSMKFALPKIAAELKGLVLEFPDSELYMIMCDAKVQNTELISLGRGSTFKFENVEWKGLGGTDMQPGFAAAEKHRPDLIVCCTDMDIGCAPKRPLCPVVWCIAERFKQKWKVPYGNMVVIPREAILRK
jgi:predicted metal-dependent peptidase